ncbi:MAG: CocE/NonD family hydrolase, partial [Acidobacteria bacterium]|nr:CocE/NonD family hydrolase [Acidobacteriota bacterium]
LKNADERYFQGEIAFWNEMTRHPNYDAFWQSRNLLPHLSNISAAVMTVGGWFDTEDLYGPLNIYRSIEEKNPGAWNVLVMGPWVHGGWTRTDGESLGLADFGFKTSEWYKKNIDLAFFRHFLKGAEDPNLPEALVFETGANRWRRFDSWPPKALEARSLYLLEGGGLAFEPPSAAGDAANDSYVSDPAKPVPYTLEITAGWAKEYMAEDQRFAAWRPDVLVYESEVLEEDLTLAGPVQADLWVSTTGTDSDWIVKVIDVFPGKLPGEEHPPGHRRPEYDTQDLGGTQRLVRAEVMRGRFRESYERPKPFVPEEPTRVRYTLNDFLHTFQKGHKVMVQIQSTWFPLVDRNPQTYVENIFEATEEDFVPATQRVYRSKEHPSRLEVGVLPDGG